MTQTAHSTAGLRGRTPADTRGFWRILLAIVAPLPMLAKAIFYLVVPVDGDASFADTVAGFSANRGVIDLLVWLDAVFVVGLVPATIAAGWVARRGAPRLATSGAFISLTGFFAGVALLGGVLTPATLTVRHGLDPAAVGALDEAVQSEPMIAVAGLLFIVGVVIGLGLLGIALWRSRVAPAWVGIAVLVGGATHPFLPGHVAQGIGLLVAAGGFVGVSLVLLRTRNDGFDLAPTALTQS